MRLTILALAMLPMAAQAQNTTVPAPTAPLAQSQSCPVGMAWDTAAQSCATATDTASPMKGLSDRGGCNYGAAREVTS
jgi:hypothetical protein